MRVSPFLFGLVLCLLACAIGPAFGQAPDWQPQPEAYESTMNVIGQLFHDGLPTAHPGDRLAAFVGEELRGATAPLEVSGVHYFFLTVYANTDGETITFKTYDAGTDQVRTVDETLVFQSNAVTGTLSSPFYWNAGSAVTEPPLWTVNAADYAASMTITATLSIEGLPTTPEDQVAAFVNNTVRGVASTVEVAGQAVHFLTVHANQAGEAVSFKVYDASDGRLYDAVETLDFAANAFHGSVQAPFLLTAKTDVSTATEQLEKVIPAHAALGANYPNPFNPRTTIPYDLAEAGPVRLTIHDTLGRRVATLVEATRPPGRYTAGFDASGLPSGLYLYRLQAGPTSLVRPMLLLK